MAGVQRNCTRSRMGGRIMKFTPLRLDGAWLIEPTPFRDERGSFARTFCVDEFASHGLETVFPQHSVAVSVQRGTLRGLHFQRAPHVEIKVVRCVAGAIYDVIVDLRPGSPTYGHGRASSSPPRMAASSTFPRASRTASRPSPTTRRSTI